MSEYEQYKRDRQRLIETTRVKMSTPDGGAGVVKEDYQPIKPNTFKKKWENYWYHYKWITFGVAFAFILVIVFVWQIIFKIQYDAKMVIVSEYPFDVVTESYQEKLKPLVTEFTKNNKIDIEISSLQQDYSGKNKLSPEIVQANFVKLSASISELDCFIYMIDEATYKSFKDMDLDFMDLTKLVDSKKLDKPDRYSLKGTKLAEKLELGKSADNMYLCFMNYDTLPAKRQQKKNIKSNYNRDITFFKEMLKYQ